MRWFLAGRQAGAGVAKHPGSLGLLNRKAALNSGTSFSSSFSALFGPDASGGGGASPLDDATSAMWGTDPCTLDGVAEVLDLSMGVAERSPGGQRVTWR